MIAIIYFGIFFKFKLFKKLRNKSYYNHVDYYRIRKFSVYRNFHKMKIPNFKKNLFIICFQMALNSSLMELAFWGLNTFFAKSKELLTMNRHSI